MGRAHQSRTFPLPRVASAPHPLSPMASRSSPSALAQSRPRSRPLVASRPPTVATPDPEAKAHAKAAGLHWVTDTTPGLTRHGIAAKTPAQPAYRDAQGRRVRDPATLARIRHLAIPPAWTEVWICPTAHGHLQATGRDARARKQYRYHADWRSTRDDAKFSRTVAFGRALPRIRRRVARDLRRPGLGREKVLAAMVRLLETTLIRVGNEEYFRTNRSVGLTTMRDRNVTIRGGVLHFTFLGKSRKHHEIDLADPQLARIVRKTQDLPGQELFQYLDDTGAQHLVTSTDVNAYLQEIAGEEFSAKDFRTWAGTVLAAMALHEFEKFDSHAQAKRNLVAAIERVARRLGNTPTICRKCYIHPAVMESYLNGETVRLLQKRTEAALRDHITGLQPAEAAVLAFLQARLRKK